MSAVFEPAALCGDRPPEGPKEAARRLQRDNPQWVIWWGGTRVVPVRVFGECVPECRHSWKAVPPTS